MAAYPADCQPSKIEFLDNAGGFSGARLWRLSTARGRLSLRRWPAEHPDETRLGWIQSVVTHVGREGFELLPEPVKARNGDTVIRYDGHLWELATWLPGVADYWKDRRPEKLHSAAVALARFHRAAESFRLACGKPQPSSFLDSPAPSPGIRDRRDFVQRLRDGKLAEIKTAITANHAAMERLVRPGMELLARIEPHLVALQNQLDESSRIETSLQPCLRDVWHDHVLFVGDQVSGIVDMGAVAIESVAADAARLFGSLCGNDRAEWSHAIESYESVRPFSEAEHKLIPAFDLAQRLLAGVKWVEWVFLEHRTFSDPDEVVQRMERILGRLHTL